MENVPFIKVNGIESMIMPNFFTTVSESEYFKGMMLILLFSEVITTILMCNFKVENHRTSNIFKKFQIFFSSCFLIEFIFNFLSKPKKYFKKLRYVCDFIALILSFISIYYENVDNYQIYRKKTVSYQINNTKIQINNTAQNETSTNNETYSNRFYSWNNYRKQRAQMEKSPIVKSLKFLREKVSFLFTNLCTPQNSPFNYLQVFQSIRLVRIFYMNKYLKTEFTSLIQVTSSSSPILLIFSVFICFFGFVGNYLYSKGTPSLFGTIFKSMFTVFGVSTKDAWVQNTKLINKGIIQLKEMPNFNQTKVHEFENFNKQNWKKFKQFIPKQTNFNDEKENSIYYNYQFDSDFKKSRSDFEYSYQKVEPEKENKNEIENEIDDQISSQFSMQNDNEFIQKEGNSIGIEKVASDNVVDETQLTFEGLKRLQMTNARLFKAKTIIHNSYEYTLKKRAQNSTYSVWFTVSIVTVLGTILSTFIVSGVTDTFTSGTENYKKKEKRKAIRKVVKLLKKYKEQLVHSEKEEAEKSSNPEILLGNKQFNEMLNILIYLKKSKDSLKDFIKDNKVKITNYKESQYNYNFQLEYYNGNYFEFENEDNFKKEVLKRRRLIEELEIMLQFYLEQAQNAFITEVKEKHKKNTLGHLRDITRNNMKKQKERKIKSMMRIPAKNSESCANIETGHNNISLDKIRLNSISDKSLLYTTKINRNLKITTTNINESSNFNNDNKNSDEIDNESKRIKNQANNTNENEASSNINNENANNNNDNEDDNNDNKSNKNNNNYNNEIVVSNENGNKNNDIKNSFAGENAKNNANNDDNEIVVSNENGNKNNNNNNENNNGDNENNVSNDNTNTNNVNNSDEKKVENNKKDRLAAFNAGSLHRVDLEVNSNTSNEIAIDESGTESASKSNEGEIQVKLDINSDGFEDISVEDYSEAYDSSDKEESSGPVTLENFECFGAAANVGIKDVERLPPPPSTKKSVIFNPQFVRAMKTILSHLINDLERYIELQSALIARLSELSNGL